MIFLLCCSQVVQQQLLMGIGGGMPGGVVDDHEEEDASLTSPEVSACRRAYWVCVCLKDCLSVYSHGCQRLPRLLH